MIRGGAPLFDEGFFFTNLENKIKSTFVPQITLWWAWGVKIESKCRHQSPYLCLVMGFQKSSMFGNRVHLGCTWEDMGSEEVPIFFNTPYFGRFYLAHFKSKWRSTNGYRGAKWRAIFTLQISSTKSDKGINTHPLKA